MLQRQMYASSVVHPPDETLLESMTLNALSAYTLLDEAQGNPLARIETCLFAASLLQYRRSLLSESSKRLKVYDASQPLCRSSHLCLTSVVAVCW